MKFILFITGFLLLRITGITQPVQKVSIDQLDAYIQNTKKPLVVNFYASWCAPCLHELPYFQETIKQYSNENVELVLVSMDIKKNYPVKLNEFVKKNKLQGTLFWLNETNADVFCPRIDSKWDGGIPATLFINISSGYRKFFERQLTEKQFKGEVKLLVSEMGQH